MPTATTTAHHHGEPDSQVPTNVLMSLQLRTFTFANASKQCIHPTHDVLSSLAIRALSPPHPLTLYRISPYDKPLPFIKGARRAVSASHHLQSSSCYMSPLTPVLACLVSGPSARRLMAIYSHRSITIVSTTSVGGLLRVEVRTLDEVHFAEICVDAKLSAT